MVITRYLSIILVMIQFYASSSIQAHQGCLEEGFEEEALLIQDILHSHEFSLSKKIDFTPHVVSREQYLEILTTENPAWAEGDLDKIEEYYNAHAEGRMDRMLRYVAYLMGIVVHGYIDQPQLETLLCSFDINKLLSEGPYENSTLSIQAQQIIYDSLHGFDRIYDIHLHNLGYDEGNYLNPKIAAQGIASFTSYCTFSMLRYACGMTSPIGSTQEARKRIHLYAQHFPKLCGIVLPIHKAILPDGITDWNNTGSHLKNRAALKTALTFNHVGSELLSAISVHPFDPQWKEKLMKAREKGICLVKWMPPQSIPPDSDRLDAYYLALKELGMTLIAHAGPEHAIPTTEDNIQWVDYGNPLRFRKPLQLGVNVILAHCGHKDEIPDLDHPERPLVPGYQLFIRLCREAHQKNLSGEWSGKLYGDLAAVTTHYGPDFIKELLLCANEEGVRLIYGSDYPYTNLIKPRNDAYNICSAYGLFPVDKVAAMQEIRAWNPLLANMIFTRNLEWDTGNGEKLRFPDETFNGLFKGAELNLIDRDSWERYKHLQN